MFVLLPQTQAFHMGLQSLIFSHHTNIMYFMFSFYESRLILQKQKKKNKTKINHIFSILLLMAVSTH